MMEDIRNVVIINGSPKVTQESFSQFLGCMVTDKMATDKVNINNINVRTSMKEKDTDKDFELMLQADVIIFIFPLYVFCLPGILMRYLQDFNQYRLSLPSSSVNAKVYAIVNCGFPESYINEEAVRVIECVSDTIGANFRFGIMIGGGGMIPSTGQASFMKRTMMELEDSLSAMTCDISNTDSSPMSNRKVNLYIPTRLYYFMGGRGWKSAIRKNGLKKKDLYRRPYLAK